MLARLPPSARTLDLCCGTGQLAQGLARRGYQVTGIDGSEEMLRRARSNASEVEFILEDARTFHLPAIYAATACTYDSLNHLMSLEALNQIFQRAYACLQEGGLFLSDVTLVQRCYAAPEINSTLKAAGFVDIQTYDAQNDLAWSREVGRAFFLSQRPGKDGRG